MPLFMYAFIFIILFAIFTLFRNKNEIKECEYTDWCNSIMLDCGFNPPQIFIVKGSKRDVVKIKNGIAYIYLCDHNNDLINKKSLIYMIAFLTTDDYIESPQYYTNLDFLMSDLLFLISNPHI